MLEYRPIKLVASDHHRSIQSYRNWNYQLGLYGPNGLEGLTHLAVASLLSVLKVMEVDSGSVGAGVRHL